MNIKDFFHSRKQKGGAQVEKPEPQPLRIEGIAPAPLTPEPDDAELAAQALLEHMVQVSSSTFQVSSDDAEKGKRKDKAAAAPHPSKGRGKGAGSQPETLNLKPETRDANYYKKLAERIRLAHEAARQRTVRFLAFCEQELAKPDLPLTGPGSLGLLEAELYKRLDVVDRHGGDLKTRWQHALANVLVRQMQAQGATLTVRTGGSGDNEG